MRITYLGHSCFTISHAGQTILTDPFLTGNPLASARAEEVTCDTILVSHGHSDHIGDLELIAKHNNALVIANHEIAEYFGARGCRTHGMYHGGSHAFPFGRVKAVPAIHGSGLEDGKGGFLYLGNPMGFVLSIGGRHLYFAGDTCVFSDMALIARFFPLDVAFLPIGDNYTMGPEEALVALEFLKPKRVIPMHFNTWPPIAVDAQSFASRATAQGTAASVLAPGGSLDL